MRVIPLHHNNPPDVVYFPTSGGTFHCLFLLNCSPQSALDYLQKAHEDGGHLGAGGVVGIDGGARRFRLY